MKYAEAKNEMRVDDERDVAAGHERDQATDRRAEREHRRPGRARQRVGGHQLLVGGDVGDRGGPRRLEERRCRDAQRHHHVRDPHLVRTPDEQQSEDEHAAHQIGADHQPPPIDAIDDDAGDRPDDRDRQELHDHHPGDGGRRSGEVEQQREDGDGVEPVAELRDRLADVEQTKVAIVAEKGDVGIRHGFSRTRRRCPAWRIRHVPESV